MTTSLLEKYKPTKKSQLVCNLDKVNIIQSWLTDYNKLKPNKLDTVRKTAKELNKSCILVTGNHGTCKTISVMTLLKSLNYRIHMIDNKMMNDTKMESCMKYVVPPFNIMDMMNGIKPKNKLAIVIDELEIITSTTEKNYINNLLKLNEKEWFCPVILISNNHHNKFISGIKKKFFNVSFNLPTANELKKIFMNIALNEGIKLVREDATKILIKILEHSKNDVRRLINTIDDISNIYKNNQLTLNVITEYCDVTMKKDIDIDSHKATKNLLFNYKSINDCIRQYEIDKALLPLMVHHNYYDYLVTNTKNNFDLAINIANSLAVGDLVENYIYCNQKWELQEIHGFYTCAATSFYLDHYIPKKTRKYTETIYHSEYSKNSITKMNKKIIIKTNNCFRDLNIMDYVYINQIIRRLIDLKRINECKELFSDYPNINIDYIDSLIKIDKINKRVALTTKESKEFQTFIPKSTSDKYENLLKVVK